ncbi:thiamine transporter family protein [Candidatus Phytoplasma oryzae]|uniref:Thiamine transporter family protein n=1 Tax=Candidatus Phytoplasma oryzae TaxID=203274 RepID=A0A139JR07_9MOLU|nr:hypothetical protein [Candidatus Phytoplasma oryzae]KXT29274.1 thiamine transporter family protein [Candidatus Phytoplasma oryzae]RAM57857.1 hypothetical protein DH96_00835 [Candidatus Phytoplasma oryzae]
MKISVLRRIIIVSIFISLAIISDFFSEIFIFFQIPYIGKIYKFSFIILFLSGFILGFKEGFLVCLFYSFFHLGKFFFKLIFLNQIFDFDCYELTLTCLLDFFLPDIVISFSGIKNLKKKKNNFSHKNIVKLMIIISFLRLLFFFLSAYLVYYDKITFLFNQSLWKKYYFFGLSNKNKILLFCYGYCCFLPVLVNFFISIFFILFFNSRFKKYFR